jgi:uncharacterized protein (TIGR00725 family)
MQEERDKLARLRYSICVSGAADGQTVSDSAQLAVRIGAAVAKAGHVLTTGATVGLPYHAAYGAKQAGGASIGFSPATNLREHIRKYRLPHDVFDYIYFTGVHYVGRDFYLVQSSDAVITVGGRFGSLHEFTTAMLYRKVSGVLLGSGGTADLIPQLMQTLEPTIDDYELIAEKDPEVLVQRVIAALDAKYADIQEQLANERLLAVDSPLPPQRGG